MNAKCSHHWIPVMFGEYVKCEKCGETRTNPQRVQQMAQESKELNRSHGDGLPSL